MDPFMGAGTTAVEALTQGRRFIGCDLNPLATFLARVKTMFLGSGQAKGLIAWADALPRLIKLRRAPKRDPAWEEYHRNVPWWLRATLESAIDSLSALCTETERQFARCALLKTGQWALDCRSQLPSKDDFLRSTRENVRLMIQGCDEFCCAASNAFRVAPSVVPRQRLILARPAAGLESDTRVLRCNRPPRLVLTSPPYPGVHILYHRWQVQGRRETPAPFWIANRRNGNGASHYTFGDRQRKDMGRYMADLREAFRSIAAVIDSQSVVVQLVAFSQPLRQLPSYLEALRWAGLREVELAGFDGWPPRRTVPNRKWYARVRGQTPSSTEILLVHKKKPE